MSRDWVEVLLPTYNGARFLWEQLSSLEHQEGVDWRLLAADDGSSDDTVAVLEAFRVRNPGRVTILPVNSERQGPAAAFGRLLQVSTAPHVFFCDQDDVWRPNKLRDVLATMVRLELDAPGKPILVHSDLAVVDEQLRPIAASLNRYQGLGAEHRLELRHLLVQNSVTGCASAVNRSLVERVLPFPDAAIMHDWWIALVAAAIGHIEYTPKPLVMYRQHEHNVRGARWLGLPRTGGWTPRELRRSLAFTYRQAQALLEHRSVNLSPHAREVAGAYASLPDVGPFSRRMKVLRHRFFKSGYAKTLGMLLLM